jgi:hypothetical protein
MQITVRTCTFLLLRVRALAFLLRVRLRRSGVARDVRKPSGCRHCFVVPVMAVEFGERERRP